MCGTYPSRKMGVTIQFESHTVELGAIYLMEHDEVVLEFYDQQPSFKLSYRTASGRKTTHFYTPDFFVIRKDQAGWEEWKTEEQLHKLVENNRFATSAAMGSGTVHLERSMPALLASPTGCVLRQNCHCATRLLLA